MLERLIDFELATRLKSDWERGYCSLRFDYYSVQVWQQAVPVLVKLGVVLEINSTSHCTSLLLREKLATNIMSTVAFSHLVSRSIPGYIHYNQVQNNKLSFFPV